MARIAIVELSEIRGIIASAEQLLILGHSYQGKGQNEEAIKNYEQAVRCVDETDQYDIQAKAYQCLGGVYTGASEYKKAIEYYQKAREISSDLGPDEMEVIAYQWLGYNHLEDGQDHESIKYYKEAAKRASQLGCKTREVNASIGMGCAYSYIGNFEPAEESFLAAITVAATCGDKRLEREAHTNLGHVYYKSGDFDAAAKSYLKAQEISSDHGDKRQEANSCLMLARTFQQFKQYEKSEKAIELLHKALNISKELNEKEVQTNAVHGLGSVAFNNSKYDEALTYTKMLVQLIDEPNNRGAKQAGAQKDLGMCYAYLGRYEEGLTCFKKALEIIRDLPERDLEGNINEWCGYCSSLIEGQHQEGITFYERAKQCAKQVVGKYQEYRSNQAIGNILSNTGNYEKAKEYYKEAINIALELSDKHCEATSCLNLASVCSKDCDYEVARKSYEKILNILGTESNDHLLREKALTGLGIALFNLGDTEKSIESIQEAKVLAKNESETGAENVVIFQESDPEFKEERVDALIEKAHNPSRTEILPTEELVRLEKCIKEFPASYVYTHQASSKDPLNEKVRNSMTTNVKSSAYRNLLSTPEKRENDGKFVNADQQSINFARDDLTKNESTKKPAILLRCLGPYIKSIGRISCGSKVGTCWLVTDKLVITCHHVYSIFMEERLLNPNLPIEVSFDCFHARRPEDVRTVEVDEEHDPELESSSLDYKFLRLKETEALTGRDGLGPIVRNHSLQEGLVIIVGHPAGTEEMQEETCVVVRNHSWREQLQERHHRTGLHMTNEHLLRAECYQEQGCLPYDTTLFSGASGAPVFDMNGNIVAMHTQGYTLNVQERQCSLMEFGVQFYAICEDMTRRNIDVKQYFPNYDLKNDEERMDIDN